MALSFAYRTLRTVDEALSALAQGDEGVHVLAGGTSLVPRLRHGVLATSLVLDVNRVAGLDTIAVAADGSLELGALVRLRTLETSPLVRARLPVLSRLCAAIASVQVRNYATLGGSLCAAEPFSDFPYLLVALDATVELRSQRAVRTLGAEAFITGPRRTARAADELLTRVTIPLPRAGEGAGFARVSGRAGLCAPWIGAAAKVALGADGRIAASRLVVGAAGGKPQRVQSADDPLELIDDDRCSPAYKRQVGGVLVRRAVDEACRDAAASTI